VSVGHAAPGASPPFPWRRVVLALVVALALALAGVAVAGYLWLHAYMPIRTAGTAGPAPGSLAFEAAPDEDPGITRYVASAREDGSLGVIFDVENTGRLPITIEGIGNDANTPGSLALRMILHRAAAPGTHRYEPFTPATLARGERTFLGLEAVARDTCENYARGTTVEGDSVTLRYSYARVFEREATLGLPVALSPGC
jgi:hypothetical protein